MLNVVLGNVVQPGAVARVASTPAAHAFTLLFIKVRAQHALAQKLPSPVGSKHDSGAGDGAAVRI